MEPKLPPTASTLRGRCLGSVRRQLYAPTMRSKRTLQSVTNAKHP